MSDWIPYKHKLSTRLSFGKHKGKDLKWVIDNHLEDVKYYHKKNIILFDNEAWDYLLEKARGKENYKKVTTTFYKRYVKRP